MYIRNLLQASLLACPYAMLYIAGMHHEELSDMFLPQRLSVLSFVPMNMGYFNQSKYHEDKTLSQSLSDLGQIIATIVP